ncbi:squalene synthase HpnD [Thalassovita gelatinovora]|uniref:Squalene synthase HpnD n=1 Tax=Thalassovita gelatinovora TaxID=53501 RepID=A0A0N7LUA4_THAGE|nr:squalene/phytoene synthase family protein [Thalassovita gelatinovora]QIZ79514.1 squalene/phytoene synthase family protein [Thalassovita gelatinovora]CUH62946.1 squalene synthase HpnD [Thalassovita gelatinovora]SEQ12885.1 Phytoene/squalene synthetase [Thalassovita gelatinovora]
MGFDDPDLRSCAQLVEQADPDRFRAVMAAPVAARAVLFPIFAANVEIARAPWVTQEPMIAEMRLQWWRDAVEEIGAGKAARRHQAVTLLAQKLDLQAATWFDDLIVARRWDIYRDPFEDESAFETYLQNTSSNLLLVAVQALGGGDEAIIRDIGYASGLANFLRAIPALEKAGRVPFLDGRDSAVAALAHDGLARLARARAQRDRVAPSAAPALLSAWQAGAILTQAAKTPQRVKVGALGASEFRKNLGLLWRAQTQRW